MKNIIWILALIGLIGLVSGTEVESGDRLYVNCNNATDGSLLGSTGTIKCWDRAGNVDVSETGLTNVETGIFYHTFSETTDRYWCRINCTTGAVDYMIPVWQRQTPLIASDNIGINWGDVANPTTAVDLSATDIQLVDTATDVTNGVDLNSTLTASINAIEADTSAVDTASELLTRLTGGNWVISTQTNLTDGIIVLTSTTETQIDNVEGDTDEIQGNQTAFITATGFATISQLNNNITLILTDTNAILVDTSAVDTDSERRTALTGGNWALSTQDNLTAGIVVLTSTTEGQIDYVVNGSLVDDVWDELLTGSAHNIATSAGRRLRQIAAFAIHSGTAQSGQTHSITFAAGASSCDGCYNRNLVSITAGVGAGQTRTIVDYNGTSKVAVMDRDWRVTPNATSEYQILADDTPLVVDHGSVQSATADTLTLRNYASATDEIYNGCIVTIVTGTGRGQVRLVKSYNGSTRTATLCNNWTTNPNSNSVYILMPYGVSKVACVSSTILDEVGDAIWDEPKAGHTSSNTFGGDALDNDVWTDAKAGYLDASISSVSGNSSTETYGLFTSGSNEDVFKANVSGLASESSIADAVWDELTSGHVGAGTFGKLIADLYTLVDTIYDSIIEGWGGW